MAKKKNQETSISYPGIVQRLDVQVSPKNFHFLEKSKARLNILYGSAGSAKSWSIAQYLLLKKIILGLPVRIIVCRSTGPALYKSCWLLFNDLVRKYNLERDCIINKSEHSIKIGKAELFFVSLDDVQKFKSFEKINYVWVEEASQISKDDFMQLNLRCRGENPIGINQLYFSFNPIDPNSFWKPLTENPLKNMAVCHSTYLDNPFNEQEYIDELEGLKEQDETYYKIYGLGLWAMPLQLIYTNWFICPEVEWPKEFEDTYYGLDFGFNNPTALIEINIKEKIVYERELIYESHLTNNMLIDRMNELGVNKSKLIIADEAEPARISEIGAAGFTVIKSEKSKISVTKGIDLIKRRRVTVHSDSVNLIDEKQRYSYKTDKKDSSIILEEPVKFKDHLMDAERYCMTHIFGGINAGLSIIEDKLTDAERIAIETDEIWSDVA